MATQHGAQDFVTNTSSQRMLIQLYHNNSKTGTQSDAWIADPQETVGPLEVLFETGFGALGTLDYWWINLLPAAGSASPDQYQSKGSTLFPGWEECPLQSKDAGQSMTFAVDTEHFRINLASGTTRGGMNRVNPKAQLGNPVRNVFVVMLENHSFDNMFAFSGIECLTVAKPGTSNAWDGRDYTVGTDAPVAMPTDPGHEFTDVVEQLLGEGAKWTPGEAYPTPVNSGFAANYAVTTTEGPKPPAADIGEIMLGFDTPRQLPVSYQLATEHAICDGWHASIPGPTWPNRFFLHGASSNGYTSSPHIEQLAAWETVDGFAYPCGSVFDALGAADVRYRLYNDKASHFTDHPSLESSVLGSIPQVSSLKGVFIWDVHPLDRFASDLHKPYPYGYTFIEPNYGNIGNDSYVGGSSQHPMDDVYGGEGLLKAVYEAVRNSPLWHSSMIIVTYDEHGGFFDSVPPPKAVPPGDGSDTSSLNVHKFLFDRLGVRVPALVISPYIERGIVVHDTFDHASVAKTLSKLFGMASLTARDRAANGLETLLTLKEPRDDADCPQTLNPPSKGAVTPAVEAARAALPAPEEIPLPLSGNLVGTLGVLLRTRIALGDGTEAARQKEVATFKQIKSVAEAETYARETQEMADRHAVARRPG